MVGAVIVGEHAGIFFIGLWSGEVDGFMGGVYITTENNILAILAKFRNKSEKSVIKLQFIPQAFWSLAAVWEIAVNQREIFVFNPNNSAFSVKFLYAYAIKNILEYCILLQAIVPAPLLFPVNTQCLVFRP